MLSKLKSLFKVSLAGIDDGADTATDLQLAAAMLFVEIMHADHVVEQAEQQAVLRALKATLSLGETEAQSILQRAEDNATEVVSLHEFTSVLNRNLSEEEKLVFLENIWRIIFADDVMDKYEEHLVRGIAELLYIRHADFVRCKHRVQREIADAGK